MNSFNVTLAIFVCAVLVVFLTYWMFKYQKAKKELSDLDTHIESYKKGLTDFSAHSTKVGDKQKAAAFPDITEHAKPVSSISDSMERTISERKRKDAEAPSGKLVGLWHPLEEGNDGESASAVEILTGGKAGINTVFENRVHKPDTKVVLLFQCLPLTDYWECPVCCAKNHNRKRHDVCEACGSKRIAG